LKKLLYLFIFFLPSFSYGQNTWVKKLSYSYQMQGYPFNLTGVDQIEEGADGSVYILAHLDVHNSQTLYKFYPNSNQVEWSLYGGYHGTGIVNWIERFKSTADSGIICCHNTSDQFSVRSEVTKFDKYGVAQWSHQFADSYNEMSYDVLEKTNGECLAIIDDTTYSFDTGGNIISVNGNLFGLKFLETDNGQFLVLTGGNTLVRMDSVGNVFWTQTCDGNFGYDTTNVYISHAGSFIEKVDAVTGLQIWNKDFGYAPVSDITATHDGGCMFSVGYKPPHPDAIGGIPMQGLLVRVDSLGDTLWTRTYSFPYYGLSAFQILSNGNICTGGCYLSGYSISVMAQEHSAFFCEMNEDGTYPLSQTTYMMPGDADNNHLTNFVDDALTTMLAIGQTGIARDTAIVGFDPLFSNEKINVSIDWSSFFPSGINYKYSDFDGNGIVDTTDVNYFNYYYNNQIDSFSSNYRQQLISSVEDFCLIPFRDTVERWDTLCYYMIMGSSVNPVDSIYGFAFSYHIDDAGNVRADSAFFKNSLGMRGVDLFCYHDPYSTASNNYRAHTLVCRTDFQNVYNVNDTIGIIRFNGLFDVSPFQPIISDFKAILADGTEIPFNFCTSPVIVDSLYATSDDLEKQPITIFPNPADKELKIKNGKLISGTASISIFNVMGEEVKSIVLTNPDQYISVADLPEGFYTGRICSEEMSRSFSFIVQH
jgi:hypothetical protein